MNSRKIKKALVVASAVESAALIITGIVKFSTAKTAASTVEAGVQVLYGVGLAIMSMSFDNYLAITENQQKIVENQLVITENQQKIAENQKILANFIKEDV